MTLFTLRFQRVFAMMLPLMAAALVYVAIIGPILGVHRDLKSEAEEKKALLERYLRIIAERPGYEADRGRLKVAVEQSLFATPSNGNAAAALLQQKLSAIIATHGGQVRSARVDINLEPNKKEPLTKFAVTVTFAASTVGLGAVLSQIGTEKPVIGIEDLTIKSGAMMARLQDGTTPSGLPPVTADDPILDVTLTASGLAFTKKN